MSHTVLRFDYAQVQGGAFAKAEGFGEIRLDNGAKAYDLITLALDDGRAIHVRTTDDTDELIVENGLPSDAIPTDQIPPRDLEFLKDYIGLALGWCWIGTNWRGYRDMFILSFEGLDPQVAFVAMASKVHCYRLLSQS